MVTAADRRLNDYINSRTKVIPDGAELFIAGGPYENHCLFCHNPASTIPVISDGVDTKTNMCNWCSDRVKDELSNKSAPKHLTKFKSGNLLDSLKEPYIIPSGISRYYTHLNPSQKDYFAAMQCRCYICEREEALPKPYEDPEWFDTLEIPVRGNTNLLHGGYVHICSNVSCHSTLQDYRVELTNLHSTEKRKVKCPSCKVHYHIIGKKELIYRDTLEGTYEWQCPSCAYALLNGWEVSKDFQKFYPGTVGEPRSSLLPRFCSVQCEYCNELTDIDFLQTEFSLCLNNIYRNEFICYPCSKVRSWLEDSHVWRLEESNLYIELYNDYTFAVMQLKHGQIIEKLRNGQTNCNNHIDALLTAMEEGNQLLHIL